MYKVNKISDNRIDITFDGQLDDHAMKSFIAEFLPLAEGCQNGALICRLNNFQVPTPGAMWVEMSHLPKILATVHKFDRCAVVTDKSWVKIGSMVESWLIPGMKIKAFTHDQEDEAIAWATGQS